MPTAAWAHMWILTTSCQSRGCFHGDRKRHLYHSKAVWLDVGPAVHHGLAPTVQVALAYLAPFSFPGLLPKSLVRLRGGSWSISTCWSLRISLDGRPLSHQSHRDSKNSAHSPHPGGVRTKAAKMSLAQGMQHFSCTWFWEGPPWPLPKSSGWTQVVVMSLSQLGAAPESEGVKAGREDVGHFWPHLDNKASRPPRLPIEHLRVNQKRHPHTWDASRCFYARRLPMAAGVHHALLPLQTWTNASWALESVKATASASTPRCLLGLETNLRTQSCAEIEAPGRHYEAGLELGKEPGQVPQPEEVGKDSQVPEMPRACQGPAQGFASLRGPATEQGVFCAAPVSTPRHFPFLTCHMQAKRGVTSCSQKGNVGWRPGGSR